MMITSACRGVALATSKPNLDQSYLAAAVLIISMAQQLVPNTSGHREFDRAQLITSSSLLTSIPPEGVGWTSPGNAAPPPPEGGIEEESFLFGISLITRSCLCPPPQRGKRKSHSYLESRSLLDRLKSP